MKKILRMLSVVALVVLLSNCTKDSNDNEFATDSVIPDGWITEEQSIVIEGKRYNLKVAGDPNGEGIKFLNSPHEVERFFAEHQETLVPHVVIGNEDVDIYYYKDLKSLTKNVEFVNVDKTPLKSYKGATVTVYKHGGSTSSNYIYGYGTAIQDKNTRWQSFWHLPSSRSNGVPSYGKSRPYVGNALNDEISVVAFYMNNPYEPITFAGYKNSWNHGSPPYFQSYNHVRNCIVVTKLPANWGSTGQWIGSNAIGLWLVRRSLFRSWNDCMSGYQFWQNTTLNISNVYIR